jgi:dolichol kinase
VNSQEAEAQITYRNELVRKAIHLSSLWISIFYYFVSRELALLVLVPITVLFIAGDLGRYYSPHLQMLVNKLFGWLLRRHENDARQKRLNGASYVLIAAFLSILIFPKFIAIISFTILIIGDSVAALIGRKFGKHRYGQKSFEGTLAFIMSGILIILITPKIDYGLGEYFIGFAAVIVGGLVEAFIVNIDDNLTVPLSVGATMWIAYSLLLPGLNVYFWK